jgi:transposase-like protein
MDAEYIPSLVHQPSRPSASCLHVMSWRTNPHPIHQHYSCDLKKRVVYQAFTLDKTTTQIAIDLDMPPHVVQCVLQNWRETGEVCKNRRHLGRAPLLSREAVTVSANHPELPRVLDVTCCMRSSSCLR